MRPAVLLAALLLVGAAAASAAGPSRKLTQVSPAIVHGKDSARVGWYVSLGWLDEGKWVSYCGGMLITQTTVLTAAHCVVNGDGLPMFPKSVAIGVRNLATDKSGAGYNMADVVNTVVHPRFVRPFAEEGYDIALLQLDPKTVTGKNELVALPTYIPKPRNPVPAGTNLRLVGFGELGNGTFPDVLQRTELVLEPLETCNEAWLSEPHIANFLESTAICASAPRTNKFTDACPGDSGGPLFAPRTAGRPYDTAIGLVSYGEDCDVLFNRTKYGRPGVYTNVAQLRKWVDANLACMAEGQLCPWGGTCFENPANGCASCDPYDGWACKDCAAPGYKVDRNGQCRPADCRNADENCIACAHRRRQACAACAWGYKVADGKCVLKTCLDYDRGCQQCDPASPLACTACKRHHVLDPATGKCVRMRHM